MNAETAAPSLRAMLAGDAIVVAPGIYDAFTARLVEQAGFRAAYLSGASIAYTRLGAPDIGLVSMSEVADAVSAIRERATLPLIVDIDTGFGNALNVQRTIKLFESRGATAMQLEDQVTPKRCGHLKGKELIPAAEMVGKIKAALDARRSAETLLIGRTDAIAVEGFEATLDRADAYVAAGIDCLFVEAPRSRDELAAIATRFASRVPVMANMVEGGTTPILPAAELESLGFRLVIFPGGTARAVAFALTEYFETLKRDGTTDAYRPRMLDFTGLNRLLGTEEYLDRGRMYDAGGGNGSRG